MPFGKREDTVLLKVLIERGLELPRCFRFSITSFSLSLGFAGGFGASFGFAGGEVDGAHHVSDCLFFGFGHIFLSLKILLYGW